MSWPAAGHLVESTARAEPRTGPRPPAPTAETRAKAATTMRARTAARARWYAEVAAGIPTKQAARLAGVSLSTAYRWGSLARESQGAPGE